MTATQHRYATNYGGPQWRDAPCIDGALHKNGVIGLNPSSLRSEKLSAEWSPETHISRPKPLPYFSLYNPIMWWYAAAFYSALFIPLLLLTLLWRKLLFQRSKYAVSIAGLASISYGYLLVALMYKSALLGPDYSGRLFLTVEVHAAATLALAIMAALRRSPVRTLLVCSTFMISLAWFLVGAINTTV